VKRKTGFRTFLCLAACLAAVPAGAATFFVDASSGDDAASGLSWGEAFATMGRGLDAGRSDATSGGFPRVKVAAGIYVLADAVVDFPVVLVGGYPPGGGSRDRAANEAALDAGGADRILTFGEGSAGSILDAFTLRGAAETALLLEDDVLVRNSTVADNPGWGIQARPAGRIERNQVLRNGLGGISADGQQPCERRVVVSDNLLDENSGFGLSADDNGCGFWGEPAAIIEHNRIRRTRSAAGDALGVYLACCPRVFNNEIVGTEGAGVGLLTWLWEPPPWPPPGTPLSHVTVAGNTGPGILIGGLTDDLTLSHAILWGNGGGDVEDLPASIDISYTLSEASLPGTGNLGGADPLFAAGPDGNTYLAQTAAGQAADSPALDAGGLPVEAAGLPYRATRTDGARDQGTVDLGYHAEPATFTVFRGTNPAALSPRIPDIVLPVADPGAADPAAPPLLHYRVDSDAAILVRRSGRDVELRFRYQEFD